MMKSENYSSEVVAIASQYTKEEEYWLRKLSGEFVRSTFPYDAHDQLDMHEKQEPLTFTFAEKTVERFMQLSNGSDVRLHMILVALLNVLLAKYTGGRDIVIGAPVIKQEVEAEFVNTLLVLRNEHKEQVTFKELLLQVRQCIVDASANVNYPLEMLLFKLGMSSSASPDDCPLFDIVLLLENLHDRSYIQPVSPNMIFTFSRSDEGLFGKLEFNNELFRRKSVERIVRHLCNLADEALFNIPLPIQELAMLSTEEKEELLITFNNTARDYPRNLPLHQLFQQQVEKTPHHVAVVFEDKGMTYDQLNHTANRLALRLKERGAGRNRGIGLMVENSPELAVGMIGILKTGAAFVPIDPGLPEE
ncbi:MAG: AMP-binding protein, partial [bacterium]|nr:AMP-binding protein [bacterium]